MQCCLVVQNNQYEAYNGAAIDCKSHMPFDRKCLITTRLGDKLTSFYEQVSEASLRGLQPLGS